MWIYKTTRKYWILPSVLSLLVLQSSGSCFVLSLVQTFARNINKRYSNVYTNSLKYTLNVHIASKHQFFTIGSVMNGMAQSVMQCRILLVQIKLDCSLSHELCMSLRTRMIYIWHTIQIIGISVHTIAKVSNYVYIVRHFFRLVCICKTDIPVKVNRFRNKYREEHLGEQHEIEIKPEMNCSSSVHKKGMAVIGVHVTG